MAVVSGDLTDGGPSRERRDFFRHPTGTVATFGAAAAPGLLVGLTPERLVHALGTAGPQAAGLWEFNADGAMSRHLHPGKAAMNGSWPPAWRARA